MKVVLGCLRMTVDVVTLCETVKRRLRLVTSHCEKSFLDPWEKITATCRR